MSIQGPDGFRPPNDPAPGRQPYAPGQPPHALPEQVWGPAPGFGPPPALVSRVHAQGVVLLVLGIAAVLVSCCSGVYGLLALVPAIAMAALGGVVLAEAKHSPHRSGGKIIAAWICGGAWLVTLVATVLVVALLYGGLFALSFFASP